MFGLVDWSFIITLAVILAATLIGSYLRSSRRDQALKDFDGFHVTVEKKNNHIMWGEMHVYSTGFELMYRSDVQDDNHLETSYILYRDEFPDIQAIYRYTRGLNDELRRKRASEMEKAFHPGLLRRFARSFQNFMSTATDSMGEVFGLVIGQTRKPAKTVITETSQTYLTGIGKDVVGYVGNNYDPLLERYVGTRVVAEVVEDEAVHEHVGVLKEYSSDFIELLDVYYPLPQKVDIKESVASQLIDTIELQVDGRTVKLFNHGEQPVHLERVVTGEVEKELNAILDSGEEITLFVESGEEGAEVYMRVATRLDLIVPRTHAIVRHRAERYMPETIFDVGRSLVRREGDEREIERLRQVLRYSPHEAISASKLGDLLLRDGNYAEAHAWLAKAFENKQRLPDGGTRVAQNMRLAERFLEQMRAQRKLDMEMRLTTPNGPSQNGVDDGGGI
ncbi:MAG: hypothetical protein R2844_21925 [Caldilineales bacterium]